MLSIEKNPTSKAGFYISGMVELKGLVDHGTFNPVTRINVISETRILGSWFYNQFKNSEEEARTKSWLVAQNYGEEDEIHDRYKRLKDTRSLRTIYNTPDRINDENVNLYQRRDPGIFKIQDRSRKRFINSTAKGDGIIT